MSEHVLKTWPQFFQAIVDGRKTFEVRYDDRGYQTGDTVRLREYDPDVRRVDPLDYREQYSGREVTARIGYVLHAIPNVRRGLSVQPGHNLDGYVAFSLLDVQEVGSDE